MIEIEQIQPEPDNNRDGEVFQNVKKIRVGNGKWDVDATALRLRDENGNVIIYLGED